MYTLNETAKLRTSNGHLNGTLPSFSQPKLTSTPLPSTHHHALATPSRPHLLHFKKYSLSPIHATPPRRKSRWDSNQTCDTNTLIHIGARSPGLASRIVRYNEEKTIRTHNPKYDRPGSFPIVHLFKKELPVIKPKSDRITVHVPSPETSTLSPADRSRILLDSVVKQTDFEPDNAEISTRSVLDALKEISRKRIHSDEDFDGGKRMRLEAEAKKRQRSNCELSTPTGPAKRLCCMSELAASHSSMLFFQTNEKKTRRVSDESVALERDPKIRKKGVDVETQTHTPAVLNKSTEPETQPALDAPNRIEDDEIGRKVPIFEDHSLEDVRKRRLFLLQKSLGIEEVKSPEKGLVSILKENSGNTSKNKHVTFNLSDTNDGILNETPKQTNLAITQTSTSISTPVTSTNVDVGQIESHQKTSENTNVEIPKFNFTNIQTNSPKLGGISTNLNAITTASPLKITFGNSINTTKNTIELPKSLSSETPPKTASFQFDLTKPVISTSVTPTFSFGSTKSEESSKSSSNSLGSSTITTTTTPLAPVKPSFNFSAVLKSPVTTSTTTITPIATTSAPAINFNLNSSNTSFQFGKNPVSTPSVATSSTTITTSKNVEAIATKPLLFGSTTITTTAAPTSTPNFGSFTTSTFSFGAPSSTSSFAPNTMSLSAPKTTTTNIFGATTTSSDIKLTTSISTPGTFTFGSNASTMSVTTRSEVLTTNASLTFSAPTITSTTSNTSNTTITFGLPTAAKPSFGTPISTVASSFNAGSSTFAGVSTTTSTTVPSLFGTPTTTSVSLFGASSTPTTTTATMFGGANLPVTTNSTTVFSPSNTGFGTFGSNTKPMFGSVATTSAPTLFGTAITTNNVFGGNSTIVTTPAPTFGTNNTGTFGAAPTPLFGSGNPINNQVPTTTNAITFGSAEPPKNVFGSFGTNNAAAAAATTTVAAPTFGTSTNTFGQNASNVFASNTNRTFGGNQSFGTTATFGATNGGFNFNATASETAATPAFGFGANKPPASAPAATFNFNASTDNRSTFGQQNGGAGAASFGTNSGVFTFGASTPKPSAGGFAFGQSEAPKPTFNFGGGATPAFGAAAVAPQPTFGAANTFSAFGAGAAPQPSGPGAFSIGTGSTSTTGRSRTQLRGKRRN